MLRPFPQKQNKGVSHISTNLLLFVNLIRHSGSTVLLEAVYLSPATVSSVQVSDWKRSILQYLRNYCAQSGEVIIEPALTRIS